LIAAKLFDGEICLEEYKAQPNDAESAVDEVAGQNVEFGVH
jgi:hypothetical protein